jgi:hypothetical protein
VELLRQTVPATSLVVAVDPGKVSNRVWLTSGERGLIGEPVSLPVLREGVDALAGLIVASGVAGAPTIGVEATGRLHHAWVAELERRWPGSVRLFAPPRRRRPEPSLAGGAPRPMTVTARRWSGWSARAPAGQPPTAPWMRWSARFATGAGWSATVGCSSSACTTSSRRCAQGCRPRPAMAAPWRSKDPPARPCWRVRSPLLADHRRCGRCTPTPRAGSPRPPPTIGSTAGGGCCPTRRRRAARPAAGPRPGPLPCPPGRHRLAGGPARQAAGSNPWADPDHPARGGHGPGGQLRRPLPTHRAVPDRRAPVCGHRAGPATWQSASLHRRGRISRQGLPEHRDALMGIAWACRSTRQASASATKNSAPAACGPSRPAWR